ncbi:hypothetical protein TI04_13495, partial [Achromatium sp. WMS2]
MHYKTHANLIIKVQVCIFLMLMAGIVSISHSQNLDNVLYQLNRSIFSSLRNLPSGERPLRVAISNFYDEETGRGCKPLTQSLAEGLEQYFHDANSFIGNKFEVLPRQGLIAIENECSIAGESTFSCTHSELVAR